MTERTTASTHLLAVDIGGTKVAAALIAPDGQIRLRAQEATLQLGPEPGIAQIARLLQSLIDQSGLPREQILGVGIGIPAVLEPDTDFVVWGPNLNGWREVPLRTTLEAQIGLPVCVEYDGHAAVLGEWWMGAGRGYASLVDIIIGTGVGGGLILDNHLIRGVNRLAGAAGWFAMTANAAQADTAARSMGHWESLTAGPGIAARARALIAQHPGCPLAALPADQITAKEVFSADAAGDSLAQRVVDDTADLIGLGVATIVSLINPELVVLGGSIGFHQGARLIPRITEVVNNWAQPISARSVDIQPSVLGVDAGLLGAAYAVLNRLQIGSAP